MEEESYIIYDKENDRIRTSPDCDNVYIPLDILHNKKLSVKEKFYLAMCYQYGNQYYADKSMLEIVSKNVLLKIKRKLRALNYLFEYITPEQAKEEVLKNKGIGFTCEWCGCKTQAIHEHHYLIPKSKNGKNVVKICPNCHCEYHLIYKGEE